VLWLEIRICGSVIRDYSNSDSWSFVVYIHVTASQQISF
jgi:hypothetical protein